MRWTRNLDRNLHKTALAASRLIHFSNEYNRAAEINRTHLHGLIRKEIWIIFKRMLKLYCKMLFVKRVLAVEKD